MAIYISADQADGAQNHTHRLPSKYAGSTTLSIGPSRVPSHLTGLHSPGLHSPGLVVSQLIGAPGTSAFGGSVIPEKASLANGSS